MPQRPHDYKPEAYKRIPNEPGKSIKPADLPLTPTQQRMKDKLMKQFCKLESFCGNSRAYIDGYEKIDWGH